MTKEFGALLAQVIPVVTLALGLELRQLAREALGTKDTLRTDRVLSLHFATTLGALALTMLGLALLENVSIAAAAKNDASQWWLCLLYAAVIIAFSAPVVDLAHRVAGAVLPRSRTADILLTAVLITIPVALMAATVAVTTA